MQYDYISMLHVCQSRSELSSLSTVEAAFPNTKRSLIKCVSSAQCEAN